ncbi:MAG TPA: 4-hydroxyphenylacetate 3-hydroxylase N-terminal domain-containing protein [Chloroflexota bacterium]
MTGERFLNSLRDGREVWLDGQRVDDVTRHPAFRDMAYALAAIYDLQHDPGLQDQMTYVDPHSGVRTSLSWLMPRSPQDLKRKRRNSEIWAEQTWGQLGRHPDLLTGFVLGIYANRATFGAVHNPHCDFAENIANYYRWCANNDLFLTHALGDPQVDRSAQPQNERRATPEDEEVALHVVEETREGVIVRGGKQLSTAAPFSHETYIALSQTFVQRNDPRFMLAFSIPTSTPGLKILCREPISRWYGSWGHPFLNLDEQDAMLFFDNVLVPWDRLFALYDSTPLRRGVAARQINFMGWANLCRAHFRMRLMTAVATLVAESIGVIEYREVAAKLGEMATYCEMWRLAMDGVEHAAFETEDGYWSLGPFMGMGIFYAQTSSRIAELLRQVCGSGALMQPSERDLANPELRPYLNQYMRGKDVDVEYKSRLMRLAHELTLSSFGMRQELYEYWHGGDPNRNRINLLRGFDQRLLTDSIKDLISRPLRNADGFAETAPELAPEGSA